MYVVHHGQSSTEFKNRRTAVSEARRLSTVSRRKVSVVREDGMERMVYRGGGLEEAVRETNHRGRRRA